MSSDFDINLAMFHLFPIRPTHSVSNYVNPKFAVEEFGVASGMNFTQNQRLEIARSCDPSGQAWRNAMPRLGTTATRTCCVGFWLLE